MNRSTGLYPATGHPSLQGRTILQIIPSLDAGGAERTTIDVASGLAEAGARAIVASEGGRLVAELQAKGGEWARFPAATKNPLKIATNIGRLKRLCRDEGVALVHARSRAPAWSALMAARSLKIPFVTTFHGIYAGRAAPKLLYNSVMSRGDVVIANSRYTAELIGKLYPVARERIEVIYRGTDLSIFTPSSVSPERVERLRAAWGVAPGRRIVLLAARLTGWKGQKIFIEAARRLLAGGLQDAAFVMAGDAQGRDNYVRDLDQLIVQHGLNDWVRRVGHCTDMPAAFLAAAAVAVPSTEPEAFGRSAVEAQALGTPVIVTDLGAVPETVLAPPDAPAGERTGWRIPASDPQALADAIAAALSLRASQRAAMQARARAHVEAHFSLEGMVNATLGIYERLMRAKA
ncbi:Glycosyltransferase involved in cell wall bisynthesis [Rhizobiales bacterium GAS191]|jgi:glycosyltransferase involved in cell wall biosynthesis|nr:Glycosyltransferase involved in cell wall bisynthesis [Rhizobiales bacterium GAS113]SED48481.1 Glycosyltransferase involved in cell wall bisynthesis [Rhizobiales bacterium GAS191]